MSSKNSAFAKAMNVSATTWNGAVSYASPDPSGVTSGRVSLFFKLVRGLSVPQLQEYLRVSAMENLIDTFLLVFHGRDPRGGKGERTLGRHALTWLFVNYPAEFRKVMHLIPEYGRWDDLTCLFPHVLDLSNIGQVRANFSANIPDERYLSSLRELQQDVVKMFATQLRLDLANMNQGKPCSLCSKWTPTEGDSLDRKSHTFKTLAQTLGVSTRVLRKQYNTPLRAYLKIVEGYICSGRWNEVDFNKVPSNAMHRLKKAFEKHDPERFNAWKEALQRNDPKVAKVNAKQLFPHELVRETRMRGSSDPVSEAQWKVLVDEVRKLGSIRDCIAVVDTSSSMHCPNFLPVDVAVSLGMIISEVVEGPFHGHVLTFNTVPEFQVVPDGTMFNRWKTIHNMPWGGSTNIESTFKLILDRAKAYRLAETDMPKRLIIISDMQFDVATGYSSYGYDRQKTNWESISEMYRTSGYTRPQIIFWNVNGSTTDFPVTVDETGTAMVSGFSPSILKALLKGQDLSPMLVVRNALDDERYDAVRKALDVMPLEEVSEQKTKPEEPVRQDEDYDVVSPQ